MENNRDCLLEKGTYAVGDNTAALRNYIGYPAFRTAVEAGRSVVILTERKPVEWLCHVRKTDYENRVFYLDFRNPRTSPNTWNPFRLIKYLCEDPDFSDVGMSLLRKPRHTG